MIKNWLKFIQCSSGQKKIKEKICLFCRKENFEKKIYELYFDDKFEKKIQLLKEKGDFISNYLDKLEKGKDLFRKAEEHTKELSNFPTDIRKAMEDKANNIITEFKKLENEIKNKINLRKNNKSLTINSIIPLKTLEIYKNVNKYLDDSITQINDRTNIIREINKQIFENFYKKEINNFKFFLDNHNNEKKITTKFITCEKKIKTNENDYEYFNKALININKNIDFFTFHLKINDKEQNGMYEIISNQTNDRIKYSQISEGEKVVISFLYFLEKGNQKFDKYKKTDKEIIVIIDDPVSSLVTENILTLSTLLLKNMQIKTKDKIKTDTYNQLFILSHDFYFLNDVCFQLKLQLKDEKTDNEKDFTRFVIYRHELPNLKIGSKIELDLENHLKSIYRYYGFSYLKLRDEIINPNIKNKNKINIGKVLLPSIMRNILEFIGQFYYKDRSGKILVNDGKLKDSKTFIKFINKNNHYDLINSGKPLYQNIENYIWEFEKIFRKNKNLEKHFAEMSKLAKINETVEQSAK